MKDHSVTVNTDPAAIPHRINRGHILALPAFLMMPMALLAPKGLSVLFIVTTLAALAWGRVYRKPLRWPPISFLLPFAAFVSYAAVSSVWSPTPLVTLKSSILLGLTTFGGLVLVSFANRLEISESAVLARALVIGTVFALLLIGFENFNDVGFWRWIKAHTTGEINIKIPRNPMVVYNSAISVAALFVWALLLCWLGKQRQIAILGVLLAVAILFSSESETPVFAIFLGALTALLFWWARATMRVALGSVVVAIMFLSPIVPGLLPGPETIRAEMPYLSHSAAHRIMIWKVTAKHIAENPIAGLGMNTSRSLYGRETKFIIDFPAADPEGHAWHSDFEPIPLHPHNGVLQIWLELGGIGIALLGWIIFVLVRITGQPIVMGFFITSLTIGSLSFGAWQSWWICALWLSAALLASQHPPAKQVQPDD